MRRRRDRTLSDTEVALWRQVLKSVRPLPGRTAPEPETGLPHAPPEAAAPVVPPPPFQAAAAPKAPPSLPPLAPLERRLRTQLRRGIQPIDAVIDLHGMRQDEAHRALRRFLSGAQARGTRLVLVVTGKGAAGAEFGEERGVLRRSVPHWLRLPDLRPLVVGFEEAEQRHGGAGALYVRLRRGREPGDGL